MSNEPGSAFYQTELHRLQGVLLMKLEAAPEEVERSFQQALEIARTRQAKSLELRAASACAPITTTVRIAKKCCGRFRGGSKKGMILWICSSPRRYFRGHEAG